MLIIQLEAEAVNTVFILQAGRLTGTRLHQQKLGCPELELRSLDLSCADLTVPSTPAFLFFGSANPLKGLFLKGCSMLQQTQRPRIPTLSYFSFWQGLTMWQPSCLSLWSNWDHGHEPLHLASRWARNPTGASLWPRHVQLQPVVYTLHRERTATTWKKATVHGQENQ